MTTRWPNCVFCFLVSVTVVNVQNAANYFVKTPKLDSLSARRLIAKQLINNKHLRTGTTQPKSVENEVQLSTASSWSPSTKNLYKGDWSAVRRNMGNGSAWIAVSL